MPLEFLASWMVLTTKSSGTYCLGQLMESQESGYDMVGSDSVHEHMEAFHGISTRGRGSFQFNFGPEQVGGI